MSTGDLDTLLAIEQAAYSFPWTRGNFLDSLAAGHLSEVLLDVPARVKGYFVAMLGVEEMHLLNLTVAPDIQGQGHGQALLNCLVGRCRQHGAQQLWLEVRQCNQRAQDIYRRFGFRASGVRSGYYPAAQGLREVAIVMSLKIHQTSGGGSDALE